MSKPAGSSGQNLEEILASIRKSLAEEAADGASKAQKRSAADGEGLSSRIAGARKGTGASSGTLDGALAEFFAQVSGKGTPPGTPADASRAAGEPQDPFWFLSRPNAASAAPGKDDKPAAAGTAPVDEEVKLSRPETLRPSLPPLFVANHEPAAPVHNGVSADGAERQAVAARSSPDVTRGAQPAEVRAEAPPLAAPAPASAAPPAKRPQGEERAATAPAVETTGSAAAAIPSAASREQAEAAVPDASVAGGIDRNPALEAMIAQLLEPVLVRWLDDNLPRMIDAIVRAEVARALAGRA